MPKKISCGAILYSFHPQTNRIGLILGYEGNGWYPFKGGKDKGESDKEAAKREIYEETCGLVKPIDVDLQCYFSTKSKVYKLGLVYAPYEFISEFTIERAKHTSGSFAEKKEVRFFPLNIINRNSDLPYITKRTINHYRQELGNLDALGPPKIKSHSSASCQEDAKKQRKCGILGRTESTKSVPCRSTTTDKIKHWSMVFRYVRGRLPLQNCF